MKAQLIGLALLWGSATTSVAAQTPAGAEPDGAALYRQNCRSCHGLKGAPPARMISIYPTLKSIADSAFAHRMTTDSIVGVLRHGRGKDMKSFADRLSAAEMEAVAKYVRTFSTGGGAP